MMLGKHDDQSFSENIEVPTGDIASVIRKKGGLYAGQDARARAGWYNFLAAVYLRPPTPDLVRYFSTEDFLEELSVLFGGEIIPTKQPVSYLPEAAAAAGVCQSLRILPYKTHTSWNDLKA